MPDTILKVYLLTFGMLFGVFRCIPPTCIKLTGIELGA